MTDSASARVRRARFADLPRLADLACGHAAYERAAPPSADLARRLEGLLFGGETARLRCLIAELGDGDLIGYASCAPDVSTWDGTGVTAVPEESNWHSERACDQRGLSV